MYLCIIWMSAPIEIAYHINLFLRKPYQGLNKNIPPLTASCLKQYFFYRRYVSG